MKYINKDNDRISSQNLNFWERLPKKKVVLREKICLKNRKHYCKSYSFAHYLTNISKKVVWNFFSPPFFLHRFWKQRLEKSVFKVLGLDYTKYMCFTNRLMSPKLFAGSSSTFRSIFSNICKHDIFISKTENDFLKFTSGYNTVAF